MKINSTLIHFPSELSDRKKRLPVKSDGSKYTWYDLLELGVSTAENR